MKKEHKIYTWATLIAVALVVTGVTTLDQRNGIKSVSNGMYAESVYNTTALAEQSDIVLKGKVAGISEPEWATKTGEKPESITENDVKQIHRTVKINVKEVLKGDKRDSIEIQVKGGKIGKYEAVSGTAPEFYPNENVLLFVEEMEKGYVVKGGDKGKFNTEKEIITRKDIPEKFDSKLNLTEVKNKISSKYS